MSDGILGRLRSGSGRQRSIDYACILALAVASRAVLMLIGTATQFGAPGDGRFTGDVLSLFVRWDASWYLQIASAGYVASPESAAVKIHAFFPLYPLLIRGAMALTGLALVPAALAVSNILFVLALFLVYEYVRSLGLERKVGIGAVLLICCAPHSFVFSTAYSESAFLLFLAGAVLALRNERYLLAGVLAALLSAARPNGVLFVVFALAWAWRTHGLRTILMPWRNPGPALAIALAPLGLVAYWWFCFVTTGDAFAQRSAVLHGWGWTVDWPWANFSRHLAGAAVNRFWAWGTLAWFVASLLLLRLRRYEEFAFCLASFLLIWVNVLPHSLVRYGVVLFPIFVALAATTIHRPLLFAALAAGMAALNGLLAVAFVLQWPIAV